VHPSGSDVTSIAVLDEGGRELARA
jgi:hypothetical protein